MGSEDIPRKKIEILAQIAMQDMSALVERLEQVSCNVSEASEKVVDTIKSTLPEEIKNSVQLSEKVTSASENLAVVTKDLEQLKEKIILVSNKLEIVDVLVETTDINKASKISSAISTNVINTLHTDGKIPEVFAYRVERKLKNLLLSTLILMIIFLTVTSFVNYKLINSAIAKQNFQTAKIQQPGNQQ